MSGTSWAAKIVYVSPFDFQLLGCGRFPKFPCVFRKRCFRLKAASDFLHPTGNSHLRLLGVLARYISARKHFEGRY